MTTTSNTRMGKKPEKIKTIKDLRSEKFYLRSQIKSKEVDIKQYFTDIKDKFDDIKDRFKPVSRIFGMFGGKKKHEQEAEELMETDEESSTSKSSIASKVLKIAVPLIAGRILYKRSRKFIFRSLVGYGMQQGLKYIFSKDMPQHLTNLKTKLNKESSDSTEKEGIF